MKNYRIAICSLLLAVAGIQAYPLPVAAAAGGDSSNDTTGNLGAVSSQTAGRDTPDTSELLGNIVWVIVALAIVVALMILVIKWLSIRSKQWGANRAMRTLGGVSLGQSSSMQVVEIADRIYIVGVGESITLIDKIDDPELVSAVYASFERKSQQTWNSQDIAGVLRKLLKRNKEQSAVDTRDADEASSFQQLLQRKLSNQSSRKQQLESLLQEQKKNERLIDHEE
ncbi:flagellar biosynthetic protein FliO [Paenibacillus sp. HB172176]|uniref:FliO/MopB family protein n=1 Tax=Paenibacillus sp. HB172176 TaxID=2493690 RepID=UPI00143B2F3C|nr:flagellar biosynthetic protein FliO [Paenibacillus sp. HB172176]